MRVFRTGFVVLASIGFALVPAEAHGAGPDLNGQWYGVWWSATNEYITGTVDVFLTEAGGAGSALTYVPELGLFDVSFPLSVSGDEVTIGAPGVLAFYGTISGDTIEGEAWQGTELIATWYIAKDFGTPSLPGPAPGPACDALPPLACIGSTEYCSEVIPFEPVEGPGYLNYPVFGETWGARHLEEIGRSPSC